MCETSITQMQCSMVSFLLVTLFPSLFPSLPFPSLPLPISPFHPPLRPSVLLKLSVNGFMNTFVRLSSIDQANRCP
ncbi:hypothetical protein B0T09DRAFT_97030 [Sordaria sp. MPI-SDFR-AT-0083]|nr:hypothetical protein B0T09DRAFT_97030 [Sordaria sp. MPI-SDFR-AT-0083]